MYLWTELHNLLHNRWLWTPLLSWPYNLPTCSTGFVISMSILYRRVLYLPVGSVKCKTCPGIFLSISYLRSFLSKASGIIHGNNDSAWTLGVCCIQSPCMCRFWIVTSLFHFFFTITLTFTLAYLQGSQPPYFILNLYSRSGHFVSNGRGFRGSAERDNKVFSSALGRNPVSVTRF